MSEKEMQIKKRDKRSVVLDMLTLIKENRVNGISPTNIYVFNRNSYKKTMKDLEYLILKGYVELRVLPEDKQTKKGKVFLTDKGIYLERDWSLIKKAIGIY